MMERAANEMPRHMTSRVVGSVLGDRNGPVYLGIHGWSGSWKSYDPLLPYMPENACLVTFDQPGFGGSASPTAWTWDAYCDQIFEALDAEGIESCTPVGNCAGAVVALNLALRQPERFERLVLVDPFAFAPWYFRILTLGPVGWFFYRLTFANPVGRFVTNYVLATKRSNDTDLTEGFGTVRHDDTLRYLRMLCNDSHMRQFAGLEMPITVLYGQNTFEAIRQSLPIFASYWQDVEVFELPGAGHLPIQEAAEALATHTFDTSKGDSHGIAATSGLSHAPGDPPDGSDLGHDSGVGTPLQSHSA